MWRLDDIPELTDAGTLSRGHAYARQGRVTELERRGGFVLAEVQGSELYCVRLGEGSWECDCPVGIAGAFCKHCVAVVIVAEQDGATEQVDQAGSPGVADDEPPVAAWLSTLSAQDLLAVVQRASATVDGMAEILRREYLAVTEDLTELKAEVDAVLRPRRQFYEYRHANLYAADADGLLGLLHERADTPSLELLAIVERAITLTVRTILRSDDSSGYQGDQIRNLLDVHARCAAGLAGTLDKARRRKLATWLHTFRFSGAQDFFEVDVDRYADVLTADGVAHYRELVESSAHTGNDAFAVEYARGRLAILDRDADAIVSLFGKDLRNQLLVLDLVEALDEAGLHELAVQYAERGLGLARTYRASELVDRLVQDAVERGHLAAALDLRRTDYHQEPSSLSLAAYRSAARAVGVWELEQVQAEEHMAAHRPHEWISVLLAQDRDDEAWEFAASRPTAAEGQWERLCRRRMVAAPADTIPYYRALVDKTLQTAGRGNYIAAARLLLRLREACTRVDRAEDYRVFMAGVVERNRRRPTCLEEFRRGALIGRDGVALM